MCKKDINLHDKIAILSIQKLVCYCLALQYAAGLQLKSGHKTQVTMVWYEVNGCHHTYNNSLVCVCVKIKDILLLTSI